MKAFIALLILGVAAIGGEPPKRIKQIEDKFGFKFLKEESDPSRWIFIAIAKELPHVQFLPLAVPVGATDRDIDNAVTAVRECASFYEQYVIPKLQVPKTSVQIEDTVYAWTTTN